MHTGLRGIVQWVLLFAASASLALGEPASEAEEYEVKALFIFNFLRFVEWPSSGGGPAEPFRVVVASDDTTLRTIARALSRRNINGRRIDVHAFEGQSDPRPHILFVTRSAPDASATTLKQLATAPVLTVGEQPGFAATTGIINFVLVEETVRLEVNVQAAERSGLQVSARLAAIARIVKSKS